ncbi:MAG TPA: type II toxin-antitoxin system VapC family toxin [Rhizomicrobium sp.]|nr:type II toxin-antitoxin system VapC family toxin [Rhizomicrobium sp.]
MNVYLDASAVVSIFVSDAFSGRIDSFLRDNAPGIKVSDFGAAEFVSVLGIQIRIGNIEKAQARIILRRFDAWIARAPMMIEIGPEDIRAADAFLRRLDLVLRTPDAIHIAAATRLGLDLVTFDSRMAACARAIGASVANV